LVALKEIAVKKYVVKLSAAEREQLETLIRVGRHPAAKLLKARIRRCCMDPPVALRAGLT
jgi:hypothetical protein